MPITLSPSVNVTEQDLSQIVPGISTSAGAFAGKFVWGPVDEVRTMDSEQTVVEVFGKPDNNTAISFFTASNFLGYGNNLQLARSINHSTGRNAISDPSANAAPVLILNESHYLNNFVNGEANVGVFVAKFPGQIGDSLLVSMADSATFTGWEYADLFDAAPNTSSYANNLGGSNDELHVIVIDENGLWTGTPGTVLEKFQFLSKANDAKQADGTSIYYKQVINNRSKYLWWTDHPDTVFLWGKPSNKTAFDSLTVPYTATMYGGNDGNDVTDGNLQSTWSLFRNDEKYDISLIPTGDASATLQKYIMENIAEHRRDCVAFISPPLSVVHDNINQEATDSVNYRNGLPSTSYGFLDSGWKYQYDPYNDVYRYIPLNGDIAGCAARTDYTNDPWWSPAGLNRGQIKNVVRLAFSPGKTERDILYPKGINPVVSFPGQGTVLFGDKTLLAKPSAFDRINVRRLFIVLEKSIATAAKWKLFEINDEFTRASFVNMISPFLRDVQGRRGVTDFKIVCNATNNTPEVIDRGEFIASIFIKPSRSINWVTLNFVSVRSGVYFDELGA